MAILAPIKTALKISGCNKNLQSDLASDRTTDRVSYNCSPASASERYIFRKIIPAETSRPFKTNQRGLSGIKKIIIKNSIDGILENPNIPRQTSLTIILFIQSALKTTPL